MSGFRDWPRENLREAVKTPEEGFEMREQRAKEAIEKLKSQGFKFGFAE